MKTAHPQSEINTPKYYVRLNNLHVIWHDFKYITKLRFMLTLFLAINGASSYIQWQIKYKQ